MIGILLSPSDTEPEGDLTGSVAVCHPHPLYGGNRHNMVVDAVFRALPAAGFRALRFDFRAVHGGDTDSHADTDTDTSPITDVVAAIDELTRRDGAAPVFVVGYSFGAVAGLRTADPRIAATVAIAPPLPVMPVEVPPAIPVYVLAPRHDQFASPQELVAVVAGWPHAELSTIDGADHFLAGHTADVATRTIEWLLARSPRVG